MGVFRNETLDATHLAEFHQIEGVIADRDLTLGDLIGVLYQFFKKLGIEKLRFKPAYNPYTEPSMEIFAFHPGLDKWVEIGNSGMFRPEMLLPMGLPEDVRVIAWGLSLERPTMIKYGIDNIRDLFGSGVQLDFIRKNPICRFDVGGEATVAGCPAEGGEDFDLDAQRAAARARAKEFAASLTPEEQAIYGAKVQVAASGVRPDSDEDDDGGADFAVGGADDGVLLGDY